MPEKTCNKCNKLKSNSEFHFNKNRKDKLASYCKQCTNNMTKQWRLDNPKKGQEYTKQWRLDNSEKVKEQNKRNYMKHKDKRLASGKEWRRKNPEKYKGSRYKSIYGINYEDYHHMLESQNNGCAICGKSNEQNRRLAIDHCHITGKIRGLLCGKHNRALGLFSDSVTDLEAAIIYLKRAAS